MTPRQKARVAELEKSELRRCPFCGSRPVILWDGRDGDGDLHDPRIECVNSRCSVRPTAMPIVKVISDRNCNAPALLLRTIVAWNTRRPA